MVVLGADGGRSEAELRRARCSRLGGRSAITSDPGGVSMLRVEWPQRHAQWKLAKPGKGTLMNSVEQAFDGPARDDLAGSSCCEWNDFEGWCTTRPEIRTSMRRKRGGGGRVGGRPNGPVNHLAPLQPGAQAVILLVMDRS